LGASKCDRDERPRRHSRSSWTGVAHRQLIYWEPYRPNGPCREAPRGFSRAEVRPVRVVPTGLGRTVRPDDLWRVQKVRMGSASHARAEMLFDVDTVVSHYLRVLVAAAAREHFEIEHWPGEVPSDIHE
jgi:hypothetical protein